MARTARHEEVGLRVVCLDATRRWSPESSSGELALRLAQRIVLADAMRGLIEEIVDRGVAYKV